MGKAKPIAFVRFVEDVLRVRLTAGQRVLARVAYDGATLADLDEPARELCRRIFGDLDEVPAEARGVVAAVCGARGGKSYVLCALRLLHLALTVPVHTLAPGEQATAIIVAPDTRLARVTLRYALGAARSCAPIAARLRAWTADGFTLEREDGRLVSVECLPASRGGSALRGRTLVGAVLDEAAFFRDEDSVVNDVEVFRALSPRIVPEGQIILASTPWVDGVGLLQELFASNHGKPRTAIAAHAPTTLLRDDARTLAMVEDERRRDPDNAAREFDAEFMPAGSALFFDPHMVDAAVRLPDSARGEQGIVAAAADFGFKSDSSALVVVQLGVSGVIRLLEVVELRPRKGAPLVPSQVAAMFGDAARRHGAFEVIGDLFSFEAMREHMQTAGVALVAAASGQNAKVESYAKARTLIHDGRVRLPESRRLVAQLKAVTSKPTAGGGLTISSPRRAGGGHGDIVSALVLALGALPSTTYATTAADLFDPSIQPLFAEPP